MFIYITLYSLFVLPCGFQSEVHIESVAEQHAGTYTCLASSLAGSDHLSYVVRVATAPRVEEDWADGDDSSDIIITTPVNRPAVLSCRVHANPDPQIFWFKVHNI